VRAFFALFDEYGWEGADWGWCDCLALQVGLSIRRVLGLSMAAGRSFLGLTMMCVFYFLIPIDFPVFVQLLPLTQIVGPGGQDLMVDKNGEVIMVYRELSSSCIPSSETSSSDCTVFGLDYYTPSGSFVRSLPRSWLLKTK
jgi:hypothetical protein